MPPNATTSQKEIIDLLHKKMSKRSLLGVVSFGQRAVVECAPQSGGFPGFSADVNPDQSALADAVETALSLIPPNTSARILIHLRWQMDRSRFPSHSVAGCRPRDTNRLPANHTPTG
jgi:hypothetical protein